MYLRAVCGTSDHREDRPTEDAHVDKIQEAMVLLMSLVQVWALDDDGLCPAANSTSEGPLGDILTPHVSPSFGFPPCQRVPLSRKLSLTSYAWLTHSVLSSMILPQLSISFLSPTPSQFPIFLLGGTLASAPRPAQHIPANKGTEPALMLRLLTVPRFPSSGGVCSSWTFLLCKPFEPCGLQAMVSSCPVLSQGLSPTTFSSMAGQTPLSPLRRGPPSWLHIITSSQQITHYRSSSITPLIHHRH